jgi:hypothetical protein
VNSTKGKLIYSYTVFVSELTGEWYNTIIRKRIVFTDLINTIKGCRLVLEETDNIFSIHPV